MVRWLTVGDGNLSFSRAVWRRYRDRGDSLVATTFDSRTALLDKYPESAGILRALSGGGRVRVLHNVDATRLQETLREQLGRLGDEAAPLDELRFERVVFNFPHLGVEDQRVHRRLLATFLRQAAGVLAEGEDAQVWISLMGKQPDDWCIRRCCASNNQHSNQLNNDDKNDSKNNNNSSVGAISPLFLASERPFAGDDEWPGYECRRHQSGRRFPLQDARTFVFTRRRPSVIGVKRNGDHDSSAEKRRRTMASSHEQTQMKNKNGKEKKRQRKKKRVPHWEWVRRYREDSKQPGDVNSPVTCPVCARECASDRALNMHCQSLHRPSIARSDEEAAAILGTIRCPACPADSQRTFPDAAALRYHRLAVHAGMSFSQQNFEAPSAAPSAAAGSPSSSADIVLQPVDAAEIPCKECCRTFPNARALAQHAFFAHKVKQ
eukprot:TRINITY_DN67725_c5_g1_i1.p1 TRINITY_DN67725_c5_g1~~TRINITY_DN67725_c5_g1_i1.p1  ORF type:complete len:435 (-),score=151.12 TRINITY_DN67725_c5_g1_i1:92-1396(-)